MGVGEIQRNTSQWELPGDPPRGKAGSGEGHSSGLQLLLPYQIGPEPCTVLAPAPAQEEEVVLSSGPSPPQTSTLPQLLIIVHSGLGNSSFQGLRMSKFLCYSWSLDFYHPSILVNSERQVAGNARAI